MFRKVISLFLLGIFLLSATAPTIVSLFDENYDTILLMDMSEEESKEKESSKDAETKIVHVSSANLSLYGLELSDTRGFHLKKYAKPYLNLLSPPPEVNIL